MLTFCEAFCCPIGDTRFYLYPQASVCVAVVVIEV